MEGASLRYVRKLYSIFRKDDPERDGYDESSTTTSLKIIGKFKFIVAK